MPSQPAEPSAGAGERPRVPASAAQAFGHGLPWLRDTRFRMKMPKDQVWRIEIESSPLPVRVVRGSVWITQDGDQQDHIIQASHRQGGERFTFSRRGGATLSALEDALLEVG